MIDDRVDYGTRWHTHRIPVRYQGLRVEDSTSTTDNAHALSLARYFARSFGHRYARIAPEDQRGLLGRGMLLIGKPGTGKTRIACATATDTHYAWNYNQLYLPVTNYFALGREQQKFTEIAEKLRDPQAVDRVWKLQELADRALKTPLLIFDDMGKEYSTASGWVGTEIHRILRTRHDKGRPTIVTTNMPLKEWQKYDGAMYSFLTEAFDIQEIGGEDWRRAER